MSEASSSVVTSASWRFKNKFRLHTD